MNKRFIQYSLIALTYVATMQMSFANSHTQIGRYLTVENKPSSEQIHLLTQIIQVRFPHNTQTIADAMHYLLRFSGYSLAPTNRINAPLKITLNKPLPAIDRNLGPMSLQDALTTLAGPAFYLVQDPINRTVDFHLKPQYARLYQGEHKTKKVN